MKYVITCRAVHQRLQGPVPAVQSCCSCPSPKLIPSPLWWIPAPSADASSVSVVVHGRVPILPARHWRRNQCRPFMPHKQPNYMLTLLYLTLGWAASTETSSVQPKAHPQSGRRPRKPLRLLWTSKELAIHISKQNEIETKPWQRKEIWPTQWFSIVPKHRGTMLSHCASGDLKNDPVFLAGRSLRVWLWKVCPTKHWRENNTFCGHACNPKLTWGSSNFCLTTNSSRIPWGRVAMPLISPLMPVLLYCTLLCTSHCTLWRISIINTKNPSTQVKKNVPL